MAIDIPHKKTPHPNPLKNQKISIKYTPNQSVCMQENKSIIAILGNINSTNLIVPLSPLNCPNSIKNAQNPNLSKKTPSPHPTPKNNTQLKHGTQSSSKPPESEPKQSAKEDIDPTSSSSEPSTIILAENGASRPCTLLQHHTRREGNSDSDPKFSLHCSTDIQRSSHGDEQLHQLNMVEQHPKPHSPISHHQPNSSNEGGLEYASKLCQNLEPNSGCGSTLLHPEIPNHHESSVHTLDCTCKPSTTSRCTSCPSHANPSPSSKSKPNGAGNGGRNRSSKLDPSKRGRGFKPRRSKNLSIYGEARAEENYILSIGNVQVHNGHKTTSRPYRRKTHNDSRSFSEEESHIPKENEGKWRLEQPALKHE
uniref:Uncharacterized protein n=1 Tax=Nicotiana tabacum TaxID=4097 RepID=A0A1S4CJD6_TOBAC|nr:PREDICTED: uncharacterized protein LOC107819716 [Nicotiana tabacum]